MALARIFGDDSKYVPEDFGRYVDTENVGSHLAEYFGSATVRLLKTSTTPGRLQDLPT